MVTIIRTRLPGPLRSVAAGSLLVAGLAACASDPYGDETIVLCYRTLADVICYDRPDEGRERQLVGFYTRPADDPGNKAVALAAARARLAD